MKAVGSNVMLVLSLIAFAAGICDAKTVTFAGRTWTVRATGSGGPGPNNWNENNAWVDTSGQLHLKISTLNGKWYCAEVYSNDRLGFGQYQWYVSGRVDMLDRNVVLGLFNYNGTDGVNEIDIEMARWGSVNGNMGNFTVYPSKTGFAYKTQTFPVSLSSDYSTHRFTWQSTSVLFQMLNGHRLDNLSEIGRWSYKPVKYLDAIPQKAMPLHMNLWLFRGAAPSDGKEVEIIIKAFQYVK